MAAAPPGVLFGGSRPGHRSGRDHAAVTLEPDRDGYDSPIATRGGYVSIGLSCPDGHEFDLVIANHKGAEYLGVVPRRHAGG
jgi:hypothetical protein